MREYTKKGLGVGEKRYEKNPEMSLIGDERYRNYRGGYGLGIIIISSGG
jgi:hypothetical protein